MADQDFRDLVAKMRHAQKEYFRTRSPTSLEESKRLERAVDKALTESAQKQGGLFDG